MLPLYEFFTVIRAELESTSFTSTCPMREFAGAGQPSEGREIGLVEVHRELAGLREVVLELLLDEGPVGDVADGGDSSPWRFPSRSFRRRGTPPIVTAPGPRRRPRCRLPAAGS